MGITYDDGLDEVSLGVEVIRVAVNMPPPPWPKEIECSKYVNKTWQLVKLRYFGS